MNFEFRGEVWVRDIYLRKVSIEKDFKLDWMRLLRENRDGTILVD